MGEVDFRVLERGDRIYLKAFLREALWCKALVFVGRSDTYGNIDVSVSN